MELHAKHVFAGALLLLGAAAQAGQSLHFKAGVFDPAQKETQVLAQTAPPQAINTEYYVVQFKDKISPQDRKDLEALGLSIQRYIPDDALIIKGDPQTLRYLSVNNDKVRVSLAFAPNLKLSPRFEARSVFNKDISKVVQLYLFNKDDNERVVAELQSQSGVQVLEASNKVVTVQMPLGKLDEATQIDGVEFVEPAQDFELFGMAFNELPMQVNPMIFTPSFTGYETGTAIMGFATAWSAGLTGAGQIVAMADTGLDSGVLGRLHPDFGNVRSGRGFGLFSRSWADPNGHGTHVAGSVMGSGAASGGTLMGGAPGATMHGQGMWSTVMGNITPPRDLSQLFADAYQRGARVHTNSWGSNAQGAYTTSSAQVDDFMWRNPDFLILFAAGNSGVDANRDGRIDLGSVASPATAKNAVTVGASENYILEGGNQKQLGELKGGKPWGVEPLASDRLSDNASGIAAFSSRGPARDGRIKPDVVAPGTNIVSVCSTHKSAGKLWGQYNDQYCFSGGTSMSTPLVAGAAAVIREALVRVRQTQPSAALVKALLMGTAIDLFPGQYGTGPGQEMLQRGPNNQQGYGLVNMAKAVDFSRVQFVDDKTGVTHGRATQFQFSGVIDKITLVYTDAPGSPSASKTLVNNLDLVVELPGGQILKSDSQVNNSEQISLGNQDVGTIRVSVVGTSIPQSRNGALPYALVVSR